MLMKRRHFLQFSSSLLASLGMSQLDLMHQANRYAQVLAQSTPRKLALLVGINEYEAALNPLYGCVTDVNMQRELLVYRFGFNPTDILEVTDVKATRQGILTAFEEHLIKQAKPGDVVVFHYSGHGSQVLDPEATGDNKYNSAMVPIDRSADSANSSANPVPDIMGHTLFLLMSAVPTENLTVVLDSCYSGGGKRGNGNTIVRAARKRGDITLTASSEESQYQQQWLSKLNLPKEKFIADRNKGVAKGVVIASAKSDQEATDATFKGFHAGAFTYLMTRYLWQETSNAPFDTVFVNLASRTKDIGNQNPEFEDKPGSNNKFKPLYFLEKTRPAADAVIQKVTGNQVEFWLGGVASQSLEAFKAGAIFSIIDDAGQERGQIQQQSLNGLVGKGTVIQASQPEIVKEGTFLREQVRGIPKNLALSLGLDKTLDAERAKVLAALQGQKRIELVSEGTVADYLLGRVTNENIQFWQKQQILNPPPVGALGIFTPFQIPVPESFGSVGESAPEAVQRLRPRLKFLLAGRVLQTITNGDASRLNVITSIKAVAGRGNSGATASRGTRSAQSALPLVVSSSRKEKFQAGTDVQVEVQNNESRNLFVSVLFIADSGEIVVLFPLDWDAPEIKSLVAPKQTITIPQPDDKFRFRLRDEAGTFELLVLASTQPLKLALKGLQSIARGRGIGRGTPPTLNEDEPVNVTGDLLGDLDNHTRSNPKRSAGIDAISAEGNQLVDTTQFAVISTVVEVVKS